MGKHSKLAVVASLLLFLGGSVRADAGSVPSVSGILPKDTAEALLKGMVLGSDGKGAASLLKPALPGDEPALGGDPGALRIEALVLLPYAEGKIPDSPAAYLRSAAGVAARVSTLRGIEYWSASRGRMRLLFEESMRVAAVNDRKALPDPDAQAIESAVQAPYSFTAFQRDLTFGGNYVGYTFRIGQGYLAISSENLTWLRYVFIPLVAPGSLKNQTFVVPCREGLLVHQMSLIQASEIAARRVYESAGNKSLAVLRWFAQGLADAGLAGTRPLPRDMGEVVPAEGN